MKQKLKNVIFQPDDTIKSLGLWCSLAGHWRHNNHILTNRFIPETVIIYCINGSGSLKLNKQKYLIKSGDIFICPANVVHSYQCDIDSGWEVIWLHCGGELCDKYLKSCNLTIDNPIYNISNEHQITLLFNDFATGFGDNKLENPWIAIKFLHNLFLSLHYCISNSSHNKVKNLMEYITINTDSLDEIAANAGYSKCHFIRLFKQQTGKTPWAVILEKKVNLSKELLLGTTMSIKEISDYLGFEHQDYFAKLFKKHVHVTPKNFRKNLVL